MSFSSPFPEVDIPTASVYDYLFEDLHDHDADRVALIDAKSGRQTSYREMVARIESFAGGLAARGLGVGDVVGLLAPNSSAFAVAFHGILRAGATATTINALFTAKDIAKQLGISEPTVSRHMKRVRTRLREDLKTIITTYSFTEDEIVEADQAGLASDDALFDEAICDIWNTQAALARQDEQRSARF